MYTWSTFGITTSSQHQCVEFIGFLSLFIGFWSFYGGKYAQQDIIMDNFFIKSGPLIWLMFKSYGYTKSHIFTLICIPLLNLVYIPHHNISLLSSYEFCGYTVSFSPVMVVNVHNRISLYVIISLFLSKYDTSYVP